MTGKRTSELRSNAQGGALCHWLAAGVLFMGTALLVVAFAVVTGMVKR